jgi:hypothetical protein
MELPRIPPSMVTGWNAPSYGATLTRSDAGIEDVVTTSCQGTGFAFSVEWRGLDVAQGLELVRWWKQAQLDSKARISIQTFRIPDNHPIWRNVRLKGAIADSLLVESDLNKTRWRAFEFSSLEAPDACTVFDWKTSIVEVKGGHDYFF